ncbi:MAG: hypothetical protein LM558_04305, partial [Thermosphaera sp.]|nr:hypothetical protein [Thermosphaera sp.]
VESLMRRVESMMRQQPKSPTVPTPVKPPTIPPPRPPPIPRPGMPGSTAVRPPSKPPGNPEEGGEEELPSPRRVRSLFERYGGLY